MAEAVTFEFKLGECERFFVVESCPPPPPPSDTFMAGDKSGIAPFDTMSLNEGETEAFIYSKCRIKGETSETKRQNFVSWVLLMAEVRMEEADPPIEIKVDSTVEPIGERDSLFDLNSA